jgi:hypothetical protein
MAAGLHPGRKLRWVSRNTSNPLLLVSGKLLLANLCSQAPTSTSTSGTCVRISDASSCVLVSVLWWLLASGYCFVEVVPSVSYARLRTRWQEWPLDC